MLGMRVTVARNRFFSALQWIRLGRSRPRNLAWSRGGRHGQVADARGRWLRLGGEESECATRTTLRWRCGEDRRPGGASGAMTEKSRFFRSFGRERRARGPRERRRANGERRLARGARRHGASRGRRRGLLRRAPTIFCVLRLNFTGHRINIQKDLQKCY